MSGRSAAVGGGRRRADTANQIVIVEDILTVVRATAEDFCVTVAPAKLKMATAIMEPNTDANRTGELFIW